MKCINCGGIDIEKVSRYEEFRKLGEFEPVIERVFVGYYFRCTKCKSTNIYPGE